MPFISYAINFEDVLLWRALGHVQNGFYIDVGANDPVEHSVTKAFYDRGWRGINIEPLPRFVQPLLEQRERDVNLAVAAGASEGVISLFDIPAVNGWATNDPQVAQSHREEGFDLSEIRVPLRTLAAICEEHVAGDIHFLKVDVEGFEAEVLRGMDFVRWRPWVVVVEATKPNSPLLSHDSWESLLTGRGYAFAYFDGLNRYYVVNEHPELLAKLAVQANVFDHFISADLADALNRAKATWEREILAEARLHEMALELESRNQAIEAHHLKASRQTAWAQGLEQQVLDMQQSLSWQLTRPLRWMGRCITVQPGQILRKLLRALMASKGLQKLLLPQIQRVPALHARVIRLAVSLNRDAAGAPILGRDTASSPALETLPLSVRKVLADLSRACGISFPI